MQKCIFRNKIQRIKEFQQASIKIVGSGDRIMFC